MCRFRCFVFVVSSVKQLQFDNVVSTLFPDLVVHALFPASLFVRWFICSLFVRCLLLRCLGVVSVRRVVYIVSCSVVRTLLPRRCLCVASSLPRLCFRCLHCRCSRFRSFNVVRIFVVSALFAGFVVSTLFAASLLAHCCRCFLIKTWNTNKEKYQNKHPQPKEQDKFSSIKACRPFAELSLLFWLKMLNLICFLIFFTKVTAIAMVTARFTLVSD